MMEPIQERGSIADASPALNVDVSIETTAVQGDQISTSCSHQLAAVLSLLFDGTIVFLSGGIPYWYYRLFPLKFSNVMELDDMGNIQAGCRDQAFNEHWRGCIRQLSKAWKAHQLIVGAVLAPMFPLISVSSLPRCSWAYIFAVLCLVYGLITFTICVIYRIHSSNIDTSKLHTSWYIVPNSRFFHQDVLRFYVSLSLPTIWFSGFVASFMMTILMIMIGVNTSHDHFSTDLSAPPAACNNNLTFLLIVIPLVLAITIISFVRSVKYALTSSQGTA